jgi:ribonuclease HII
MKNGKQDSPTLDEERRLQSRGYRFIAGIDEAGRGALAGPVVAAAVILPPDIASPWLDKVRDSKQLSAARREELYRHILSDAATVACGMASHKVIARHNILGATRLAMRLSVTKLEILPDYLLIDYVKLPIINLPQQGITRGDATCLSIACASIVAKVTRDRLMQRLDAIFPQYGLAGHKGYGTAAHIECLREHGPCRIHRLGFRPVAELEIPRLL